MKIVDRKTFMAMKGEVLFSKYSTLDNIGELCIKTGNTGLDESDFTYQSILNIDADCSGDLFDKLVLAENDPNYNIDLDLDCNERDGFFNEDQLFAVFTLSDVFQMMKRFEILIAEMQATSWSKIKELL